MSDVILALDLGRYKSAAVSHGGGDGGLDDREWDAGQQLQHADVLADARADAVIGLQAGAELGEHGRQCPIAVHRDVVQGRRLLPQDGQEV